MTALRVIFPATVSRYDGPAAWYFVSLSTEAAAEVAGPVADRSTGFGSVRVEARIGATTLLTSLFPETKTRTYLLPVKKAVRTAEALSEGSSVSVHLVLRPL